MVGVVAVQSHVQRSLASDLVNRLRSGYHVSQMWPDRRLLDLLGIELPIVQAPMAGAMDWELAAAVAEAGASDRCPAACSSRRSPRTGGKYPRRSPTSRSRSISSAMRRPTRTTRARRLAQSARAVLSRTRDRSGGAGAVEPPRAVRCRNVRDRARSCGPRSSASISACRSRPGAARQGRGLRSIRRARPPRGRSALARSAGADAVIAQGCEAGGHRGMFLTDDLASQLGTFALMPQIVDAVRVPVIAAGGDHRCARHRGGVRARRSRRADRHRLSVRPEAKISAPHRAALATARDRRHRADEPVDRPPGARHRQPAHARGRADLRSGAAIPARGRRARAAARQGGGAGLGRFLADVGGTGGGARPCLAGRRVHARAGGRRRWNACERSASQLSRRS